MYSDFCVIDYITRVICNLELSSNYVIFYYSYKLKKSQIFILSNYNHPSSKI